MNDNLLLKWVSLIKSNYKGIIATVTTTKFTSILLKFVFAFFEYSIFNSKFNKNYFMKDKTKNMLLTCGLLNNFI